MFQKRSREPIQARILYLFVIFIIGLGIIALTSYISTFVSSTYQDRLDNQLVYKALGEEIITDLISLENELNKLASIKDERDLAFAENEISNLFDEIKNIIQVLQNGGSLRKYIPSNFDEKNEIEVILVYKKTANESYVVEVLELLPRILDLENTANKLIATVDKNLSETTSADTEEVFLLLKQADTYLIRSREGANHIHYESHLEMQKISTEKDIALKKIGIISSIITITVIFFVASLFYRIFYQIGNLLQARTKAEISLKETEARYRTVADFTYGWEYWQAPDGKLLYVSPSCERITGYSADYIIEQPDFIQKIVVPEDRYILKKHRHGEENEYTREEIRFRIKRKDGEVVWIEHSCQPVTTPAGEFVGYRASNRDITEKVKAQTALSESEDLYRSLVENSPIGIILASPEGEIISTNLATLEIIDSPSKEETQKINLLTFPPIATSSFAPDFKTCLATGEGVQNQMAYTSKWGKNVYVRYTFTVVHGAKKDLLGIQVLLEDITEQIDNKNHLQKQVKNFATINAINTSIITRTDIDNMIGSILKEIAQNRSVDAADLLIFDEHALSLTCITQYGFQSPAGKKKTTLRLGESYAGKAALERKLVEIQDIDSEANKEKIPQRWQDEEFSSYLGVPLLVKGELKGILEVFHRSKEKRSPEWVDFLKTLAQQAAIAIENHYLLDALRHSKNEIEIAYETTLEGWASALELRDYETKGHVARVAELTLDLAQNLGIRGVELTHIRRGALLHDIGKIGISDTILLKPGPCTPEEWEQLYQHPQYGYDMLKEIAYLKPSLDIVLYHHEKWDGSGYPHGLAKEQIPRSARIFAIIDVWDALINDRPYHEAWTEKEALAYILEQKEKHFDPQIVEAFQEIIDEIIH